MLYQTCNIPSICALNNSYLRVHYGSYSTRGVVETPHSTSEMNTAWLSTPHLQCCNFNVREEVDALNDFVVMCGWIERLDVWKQCVEEECSKHRFSCMKCSLFCWSRYLLIYAVIHGFRRTAIIVFVSTCQKELAHNTLIYTVEPWQLWNKYKCPDYRGVLNLGVKLYYKTQFGTFVLNTGVSSFQGVLNRGVSLY